MEKMQIKKWRETKHRAKGRRALCKEEEGYQAMQRCRRGEGGGWV